MKKMLPLSVFLLFCMALFGQNTWYPNPEVTVEQYLYFKVDTTNGLFSLSEKKTTLSPDIHSQVTSYNFDEPNFKIGARHYKGKEGRSELKIVGIQRQGEAEILPFDEKNIQILEGDKRSDNIYVISNIAENHFEFGSAYRIILLKEFETDFNPDVPQTKMSSLWYAVPVAMAAGGWLIQNDMKNQSDAAYEKYLNAWRSGDDEENATVFLDEANDRSYSADIVSISTAGAVLITGAILWSIQAKRNKRIKLQKKLKQVAEINAKSRSSIQLNPEFSFSGKHPMNNMGLKICLNF